MLKTLYILFVSPILLFQQVNFNKERALIESSKNDSIIIDAYLKIIKGFTPSQTDSINNYFNKASQYATDKKYDRGINLVKATRGNYLVKHGQLSMAETFLTDVVNNSNEKKLKADALNTLSMLYGKKGNYDLGMKSAFKALKLYEETKDLEGQISINIKLGTITRLNGDLEKAFFYNDKAEKINLKLGNKNYQIDILNNKAIIYAMKGDFDNALILFKEGVKIAETSGKSFIGSKVNCLMNIGLIYKEKKQFAKALEYLNKSAFEAQKNNLSNEKFRTQINISLLYAEQNQYQESNKIALETLEEAKEAEFFDMVAEALDIITHNYRALNDYKNALKYSDEFYVEEGKLKNIQKDIEIANLQSTYDLEKAQEQVKILDELNKKSNIQSNLLILMSVLGLISMSVFAFLYFRIKKLNNKINKQRAQLIESNEVKNKLFSVIGHDLRSAYNSTLGFLNLLKDGDLNDEEAGIFIDKVIIQSTAALGTLDNLLMWGHSQIKGTKIITEVFDANKEIIKNIEYLKDQSVIKNIIVEVSDKIDIHIKADLNHFDFVVRNLLSNAIKFTPENGSIKISCSEYNETQQKFCVADNGIGMSKSQMDQLFKNSGKSTVGTANEKGTGLGLMLCKEYIELNGGIIWAESEEGEGSKFCFVLNKA